MSKDQYVLGVWIIYGFRRIRLWQVILQLFNFNPGTYYFNTIIHIVKSLKTATIEISLCILLLNLIPSLLQNLGAFLLTWINFNTGMDR